MISEFFQLQQEKIIKKLYINKTFALLKKIIIFRKQKKNKNI